MARRPGSWRDGDSIEGWPSAWDRADHWPTLTPSEWTPSRAAGAVIACIRAGDKSVTSPSVFTTYANPAAAERADAENVCSLPGCMGRHVVVFCEPGALVVRPGAHDAPVVPGDLAAALWAAGYRRPVGATADSVPERWPAPSIVNGKLGPTRQAM